MNDEVASRNSPSVVVISGGTAANSLVFAFQGLAGTSQLTYVLPIRYLQRSNETDCSDNGGSTSEISRVIGGPGIGDIRSRLVRLMNENTPEQAAIKKLMSHRLAIDDETLARMEWLEIVEGTHSLWNGISSEKTELLRSFLRYVQSDISKLSRPSSRFDFRNGSIGNFFLTGARLFFGSLESSIYLLSSIVALPETTSVLPIINTNHSIHIAAKLPCAPYLIVGQNQISHPSHPDPEQDEIDDEDGTLPPGTLASLSGPQRSLIVSKSAGGGSLPGKIERVFYVNPYGNEVHPTANPRVTSAIKAADVIIYSVGSLFTRETTGFESATDYVKAIVDACHSSLQAEGKSISSESSWSDYVTHLIYLRDCPIPIDAIQLKERGVECVGVLPVGKEMVFEPRSLERVLSGVCSGRGSGLQRRATIQNR